MDGAGPQAGAAPGESAAPAGGAAGGATDGLTGGLTGGLAGGATGGLAGGLTRIAGMLHRRGDIALALGVVAILAMLILPMPRWMLDISLAVSITLSVLILMTALFIEEPLQFSSFPTVLLIATMLRLALNLASTRLILAHGHEGAGAAGQVIESFGRIVMSGNFVIGIIAFAILVTVNFVVITKGSGRIAEVGARFSLDSLPGKQMAIDADLSAGLIDEEEARRRRRKLEDESSFFGAMDGAAKFVRGDAIAGLLITFINVIGGVIIGVGQQGMSFGEAGRSYTLLTVGDGLVSQIPALIVSTAAGLVVARSGVTGSTNKALFGQLSFYPGAVGLSGALMAGLALMPGIPVPPFLALGAAAGYAAWRLGRSRPAGDVEAAEAGADGGDGVAPPAGEPISAALHMDQIRLELGYGLLSMIDSEKGQRLTDQIKSLRRQLAQDMGFILPAVRIQDNLQLPSAIYLVRIKEIEAGRGDLRPNMLLVMDPRGDDIGLPGEATKEPTFGLPAMWVGESHKEEALFRGYTVVDAPTVITTHLTELIRDSMAELLSYAETQRLLDEMDKPHQKLVADMVPNQITVGGIQRVLQNLLAERVSIRDLPTILEAINEACVSSRNVVVITEHVRVRLARQLCESVADADGAVPVLTLSPEWEQNFAAALVGEGDDVQLAMPPGQIQAFVSAMGQAFDRQAMQGHVPALLTSPRIRPFVRSIIERFRPQTTVLAQSGIHPRVSLRHLGLV